MKHMIIYMHPSESSFNGAILNELVTTLTSNGNNVCLRTLYKESFQPLLSQVEYEESFDSTYQIDVKKEQEKIKEADKITLIFPLWWGGFPAIGKGYIDRVFSFGFAYRLKGETPIPLLTGKKVNVIFTTGTSEKEMMETGMYDSFLSLLDQSIFKFCGLELEHTLHFGDVIQCGDEKRKEMLKKVRNLANKLQ